MTSTYADFIHRQAELLYVARVLDFQAELAMTAEICLTEYSRATLALMAARDAARAIEQASRMSSSAREAIDVEAEVQKLWKRWEECSKPRKMHAKYRRQAQIIRIKRAT